jgi:hypothetical protein
VSLLAKEEREALKGIGVELSKIRELLEKVINRERGFLRMEN